MIIHHLNCGTCCPVGGPLMDGASRTPLGRLVCHCLLIETDRGLVLIDTGLGMRDTTQPYPRLSRFYVNLLNIQLNPEETAIRQIERLGLNPADVRHIVLTHLDFDHAGGLDDFPQATVHLMSAELDAAERRRRGFVARRRYRPSQWSEITRWRRYEAGGEPWYGFSAVRELEGLPPEILLVPLPGHTWGHAGIAIDTGRHWLLHTGDAYFYRGEMGPKRHCTPGLRAYQRLMEVDRQARLANQERLRRLALDKGAEVRLFCAHDPVEFDRLHSAAPGRGAAGIRRSEL
jgi:glyoxylase-like metal-dependent hydrolase (beta-lactamase superfamily II)